MTSGRDQALFSLSSKGTVERMRDQAIAVRVAGVILAEPGGVEEMLF